MGDDDLRQLERDVRAGAPPDVVRRWAGLLERADLLDETVAALLADLDRDPRDAHARHVLGALPAWTAAFGPGGPGVDVAPVREAPVVRWHRPTDRPRTTETTISTPPVLGGALGLAVLHRGWTEVVDPRSGARRWVTDWASPGDSTIDGHVLVLRRGEELLAHDLWTGALLGTTQAGPGTLGVFRGRVVTWTKAGADAGRIEARRWRYTAPLEPEPCWAFDVEGGFRPRLNRCGDRIALAGHGPEVAVVDAESGLCWTRRGNYACGDDRDIVVQSGSTSTCCALDGTPRWTATGNLPALGERRVLLDVATRSGHTFTFVDRQTGEVAGAIERQNAWRRHALARDVVYFFEPGGLEACSDEGASLWRVPKEALPTSGVTIVPLDRALVAYFDDLSLVCFGAAGS